MMMLLCRSGGGMRCRVSVIGSRRDEMVNSVGASLC